MEDLKKNIEQHLLQRGDWVTTQELESLFGITERQLRKKSDDAGLCSDFAISGDKGFKHVSVATTAEWLRFKHRLAKHAIAELVRVKALDKKRHAVTRVTKAAVFEKDTPQTLLRFV